MDENSIIEKIKKLLRMKRGGSTAEIETALALAQKLAAKNNININSINEDEPEKETITHDHGQTIGRLQIECKYAALIAQRFFNIHSIINGHGITFIGTLTNIEIARYVYNFLIKHFRYQWKLNKQKQRLRNRHAFMEGMYDGLWYKLAANELKYEGKEAVILISNQLQIEDYIKNTFGETITSEIKTNHNAKAAHHFGFIAGKNTNIHKGINTTNNIKLLL